MEFLSANWLWIVLIGFMLWMHLRHGGMHGGHSHHDRHAHQNGQDQDEAVATPSAADSTTGHRHGGC